MTLTHKPEHGIIRCDEQPAVAHIHFRNEDGMRRFIDDNKQSIKGEHVRWSVDWEPMLTITAAR